MDALRSAVSVGQTLLQILETRIELLGVEYRFEKARLAALVGVSLLAASSLVLAGVAGIIALVLATPEAHRSTVMLAVCGFCLLVLLLSVLAAFYLMDSKRTPFIETRRELRKDASCLSSMLNEKKSND